MTIRDKMAAWIVSALHAYGGSASVVEVAKYIWENHRKELEEAGDYFYRWQYDMRWVAQKLRDAGTLEKVIGTNRSWSLKN